MRSTRIGAAARASKLSLAAGAVLLCVVLRADRVGGQCPAVDMDTDTECAPPAPPLPACPDRYLPVNIEVVCPGSYPEGCLTTEQCRIPASVPPDGTIRRIESIYRWGAVGGITAFSLGTVQCNKGGQPLQWVDKFLIGQNIFRLKGNRFEQIGQSWVKPGFHAANENCYDCGGWCDFNSSGGLYPGCSDVYNWGYNGAQPSLRPKSIINPVTGVMNLSLFTDPPYAATIGRRLQVNAADIEDSTLGSALYFLEAQAIVFDENGDDRNRNNNASYRPACGTCLGSPPNCAWHIPETGTMIHEQPGIRAWQANDPSVIETDVQVPGDGLFILAAKATSVGGGLWDYEYAVQNLNSDRAAGQFAVPYEIGATFSNIGFHGIGYHSGETFRGDNWTSGASGGMFSWTAPGQYQCEPEPPLEPELDQLTQRTSRSLRSTRQGLQRIEELATTSMLNCVFDPNANALRWGTLYNFRFRTNRGPGTVVATIGMYKPTTSGSNATVVPAPTIGPVPNTTVRPIPIANRYLQVAVPKIGALPNQTSAVRVRMEKLEGFPAFEGQFRWLGVPTTIDPTGPAPFKVAPLVCCPVYRNWSLDGVVYAYGAEVVPGSRYRIQRLKQGDPECDENGYLDLAILITAKWGDVVEPFAHQGGTNQPEDADVDAIVARFTGQPGAVARVRAQMQPNIPNPTVEVDALDVTVAVNAVDGLPYPYSGPTSCAGSCAGMCSGCVCPP